MMTPHGLSPSHAHLRELPIGLFDSGVGGMTVLRAMREQLPNESFLYLGDTARMPYGTKSVETVRRYALEAAAALTARGIKLLVIACNTATAAALPLLREAHPEIDVLGVVEPGLLFYLKQQFFQLFLVKLLISVLQRMDGISEL